METSRRDFLKVAAIGGTAAAAAVGPGRTPGGTCFHSAEETVAGGASARGDAEESAVVASGGAAA